MDEWTDGRTDGRMDTQRHYALSYGYHWRKGIQIELNNVLKQMGPIVIQTRVNFQFFWKDFHLWIMTFVAE